MLGIWRFADLATTQEEANIVCSKWKRKRGRSFLDKKEELEDSQILQHGDSCLHNNCSFQRIVVSLNMSQKKVRNATEAVSKISSAGSLAILMFLHNYDFVIGCCAIFPWRFWI